MPEHPQPAGTAVLDASASGDAFPLLEVRDLQMRYGGMQALAGVSFSVATGEIFGLLGPNGAGKTTLLGILSGLLHPTAGSVQLFGQPFINGDPQLRSQIGLVTQDLALYGELTAEENLHFFGRLYGLSRPDLAERSMQILEAVGLHDRARQRANRFSGGMKRRLNLAIAIIHAPRLLFLDEPTTGVDPQSRNRIFELVRQLNAEGMTIIYTSHYMEEVQTLCPRIGILDQGRLIACDTLPALLRILKSQITLQLSHLPEELSMRLARLGELEQLDTTPPTLVLTCEDLPRTLMKVVSVLNEYGQEPFMLQTDEPNLERVFLHLTGRALRD